MITPVILSKATKLSYGRGIPAVDFLILTGLPGEVKKTICMKVHPYVNPREENTVVT